MNDGLDKKLTFSKKKFMKKIFLSPPRIKRVDEEKEENKKSISFFMYKIE